MDRRLIGALLLVVAILAALAGNGRTKVMAGHPHRGPIPGPPDVGSCLVEPPVDWGGTLGGGDWGGTSDGSDTDPGSGGTDPIDGSSRVEIGYATGVFGPCPAGKRFGEVVAVLPAGLDYTPVQGPDPGTYEPDPADPWMQCYRAVMPYLGSDVPVDAVPPADRWVPALAASVDVVGPNALQRADGQRWMACAAVGFADTGIRGYTGSLADVMNTLDVPTELAQCLSSVPTASVGYAASSCSAPHGAELFGLVYPTEQVLEPDGDPAQCRALVGRMTKMTDPTAGGRLEITVVSVVEDIYFTPPDGGTPDNAEIVQGTTRYCLVVPAGDDQLIGPLVGLGDGAVPLG